MIKNSFLNFHFQTDLKEKVKALLQAKPHEGCRELITALACERMLCKFIQDPNKTKVRLSRKQVVIGDKIRIYAFRFLFYFGFEVK